MTKQNSIVFLHSRGLVPPEVIHMVNEQLPAGFLIDFLEQGSPADTRLEKIAQRRLHSGLSGQSHCGRAERGKTAQVVSDVECGL